MEKNLKHRLRTILALIFCITACNGLTAMSPGEEKIDSTRLIADDDTLFEGYKTFSQQTTYNDLFSNAYDGDLKELQHAVTLQLNFNQVSPATNLTPLGIACERLCYHIKLIKAFADGLNASWCGCCGVPLLHEDAEKINRFTKVITLLAQHTGLPPTEEDRVARLEAIQLIAEVDESVRLLLLESFIPLNERTQIISETTEDCCCCS